MTEHFVLDDSWFSVFKRTVKPSSTTLAVPFGTEWEIGPFTVFTATFVSFYALCTAEIVSKFAYASFTGWLIAHLASTVRAIATIRASRGVMLINLVTTTFHRAEFTGSPVDSNTILSANFGKSSQVGTDSLPLIFSLHSTNVILTELEVLRAIDLS